MAKTTLQRIFINSLDTKSLRIRPHRKRRCGGSGTAGEDDRVRPTSKSQGPTTLL